MSWFTDAATPLPAALQRTASLLVRVRDAEPNRAPVRPWLPTSWLDPATGSALVAPDDPGAAPPALSFSEDELVHVAAAAARAAAKGVRQDCAEDAASSRSLELGRIADALGEALQARRDDETRCLHQVIDIAEAIASALSTAVDRGRPAAVVDTLRSMLAMPPEVPGLRVVVDDAALPVVRDALPELAARIGHAGTLEVVGEPRMPAGAVQIVWPGGWLEHAPAAIERELAEILAASRPAERLASNPTLRTDDGEHHDHG